MRRGGGGEFGRLYGEGEGWDGADVRPGAVLFAGAGDVNLYAFVGNGPTNGTDPTGLMFGGLMGRMFGYMAVGGILLRNFLISIRVFLEADH